MTTRLIVKNLPKKSTPDKIRSVFGDYGTITDCSLKYNKEGVFRRFAFIGFSSKDEANLALQSLHNTYLDTSKIQIQLANDLTKSVQRHSTTSPDGKGKHNAAPSDSKNKEKKVHVKEKVLGELEDDEGFQEFLDIHKASTSQTSWKNDDEAVNSKLSQGQKSVTGTKVKQVTADYAFEGDSDDSSDDENPEVITAAVDEQEPSSKPEEASKLAKDKKLSDMDYLKKKSAGVGHISDEDDEVAGTSLNLPASADNSAYSSKGSKSKKRRKPKEVFVAKLKNLPPSVNKGMVQGFLQGITMKMLNIPRNDKKTPVGVAFVHFKSQKDLDSALRRNRNMMGKKKVTIERVAEADAHPQKASQPEEKKREWEIQNKLDGVEPIADSGRLFIRNLAHSCTEEDLEKAFGEFGALTDVNLPIDPSSKRIKGFAHITYMFPEHAVQACNDLDGTNFMGRLLHILPGKPRIDELTEFDEGTDYKKKKNNEQKKTAQSSHNWNSLFLGANAVANVMSTKYGIDKSQLLDPESGQSLGVRLALGETEVVNETRDFLLDNCVCLDAFSQAAGPRSKTVILVKNLPSQTHVKELNEMFSKFGTLGRVLLPPSGISALIEFQEAQEAKTAFTKLAYTRFKHVPLYLEWAPVGVFGIDNKQDADSDVTEKAEKAGVVEEQVKVESVTHKGSIKTEPEGADSEEEEDDERGEVGGGEGCTLFVKNLNFETNEIALKKHFKSCGKVLNATVANKRDPRKPGIALSMGYGFVQFKSPEAAQTALKELQRSQLDKHSLELKLSERTTTGPSTGSRKKADASKKQTSTKILCRNIPFQANHKEVTELFKVFGELKLVRLPKKVGGQHRGFCFVDFITKNDAKRAFNALCHSTHLYGRRLVLEWADTAEESVDNLRKRTAAGYDNDKSAKKFKRAEVQATLEELEGADDD